MLNDKYEILEIQGTAEKKPFSKEDLDKLFELTKDQIDEIFEVQKLMEILLATKNQNKFIELKNIFDQSNSEHELLFYQDLIEVEEDKETIFDNAKRKQ